MQRIGTQGYSGQASSQIVMRGLVPRIHALMPRGDVDGRHKAGHDE
jgi:hypothetical protein